MLANIPAALGVRAHKDRGIRPKMAIVMPKLTAASPNIGSVIPSRVLRAGEYSVNTENKPDPEKTRVISTPMMRIRGRGA